MIVQPDFAEHWKTRLLVKLTGDESAPMAVIRLWAHCQHSRRSLFPDMTPAQLASICHWGTRKPACHVAMIRAGFVEKLSPKGFAAHQWNDHNAQLLQKWAAGQKGGRPPASEKPNEFGLSEKPTDNRPTTGTKPDQIRSDRPDQIDQTRPDPIRPDSGDKGEAGPGPGTDSVPLALGAGNGVDGLTKGLASKMRPTITPPSRQDVHNYLHFTMNGGAQFADQFYDAMERQNWCDKDGKPVEHWQNMAKQYAGKCLVNARKQ